MFDKRRADHVSVSTTPLLAFILLAVSAFTLYAQTSDPGLPQTRIGNLVIVEVRADDPSQDIGKLIELLKKARNGNVSGVDIVLSEVRLKLAPEPVIDERPVYPNPLLLIVTVDGKGNLDLNSEKHGSLTDPSSLKKRLVDIFKAREVNGVFRENTHDVEKTVSLRLHPRLLVSDLDNISTLLDAAGSDKIILVIDPPATPEKISIQSTPRPVKERKP